MSPKRGHSETEPKNTGGDNLTHKKPTTRQDTRTRQQMSLLERQWRDSQKEGDQSSFGIQEHFKEIETKIQQHKDYFIKFHDLLDKADLPTVAQVDGEYVYILHDWRDKLQSIIYLKKNI
ncbi:MAG TPA: hypothetical protein VGL94_20960 [Ktedonobacteraceae bacterium]